MNKKDGLLPQELENLLKDLIDISQYHNKEAKKLNKFFSYFKRKKHIEIRNEIVALTTRIYSGSYMHPK